MMMRLLWLGLCVLLPALAASADPTDASSWVLVWQDEFDGTALDLAKWRVEDAALVKNNERQYYAPDEVYLRDGKLVLRSRKRAMGGRPYTSGLVETKDKFAQAHGLFEVRAKLPGTQGIWPAHWMLPSRGGWPPEIDIMELVGHEPKSVHMTNHFGVWPNNRLEGSEYRGPDFTKDFHVFAVDWSPARLRWYVDGVERFTTTQNVPQDPFFLILNTAIGGDWPGEPDETTVFPQHHEIDYVRVYAQEVPGTVLLTTGVDHGKLIREPEKGRYRLGETVRLRVEPDFGYRLARWEGDGAGSVNPLTVTMDGHRRVTARCEPDPAAPPLLSQGKVARASSVEKPDLAPAFAVDGRPGTRWGSAFADPQWLVVDLGKAQPVSTVVLRWEGAYGKAYSIQLSEDQAQWRTVHRTQDGRGGMETVRFSPQRARYVRFHGTERGTEWGYSLLEFEVYGQAKLE